MAENKVNICTILDPNLECHDIIMKSLQDDLNALYSCIQVNRSFCRNFVPILWKNPFKFVQNDEQSVKLFNTLIHCLDQSDKEHLISRELIDIIDLPTPNAYFKYHTFIREFELNPLQKGMRLWTSKYLLGDNSQSSSGKKVSKRVIKLNIYIGNLLFSERNQYESLNIFYTDLLSGPRSLFDICEINNHKESLIKVNKLSLGFYHRNSTDLIPHIGKNFLRLQNSLSPNIQHLYIRIETSKRHIELSKDLINFIQLQRNLKSLLINQSFWKSDENLFNPFLVSLKKQSNSLTFLKLQDFRTFTTKELLSILKSLPNLITLDLELNIISFNDISQEISAISATHFNKLKHLNYNFIGYDSFVQIFRINRLHNLHNIGNQPIETKILLFKKILLSSIDLKSLKVTATLCPSIKQIQQQSLLNLTQFHLVLTHYYPFDDLVIILKNLDQLVHLKLTFSNEYFSQNRSLISDNFRNFSKALAHSLKILEVSFAITDKQLEILFNESQLNIQCIKLYRVRYNDTLLRAFIDYARRKNCFKELGIPCNNTRHFSKLRVEEAKNHFNITLNNDIDNPFYDVPIDNSCEGK